MPTGYKPNGTARDYHIRLPGLHPGQRHVLEHKRRFTYSCCGRRWNKTTTWLSEMVEAVVETQLSYQWCAPTYKQCRIAWDELRRMVPAHVGTYNEGRMECVLPGDGKIGFFSVEDPETARGFTAAGVVFDEASEIREKAWTEVVRGTLVDTGGYARFCYTPKGRNWVWRNVMAAEAEQDPNVIHFQAPTLGAVVHEDGTLERRPHPLENPRIPWDEMVNLFLTLPERVFRQEYLAEYLDDGGGAFRNVDACAVGAFVARPPHPPHANRFVIGVDLAKSVDWTVAFVAGVAGELSKKVIAWDRWNRCDWPITCARIAKLAVTWNDALIVLDSTGVGDPIFDFLRQAGLRVFPFKFTESSREQLLNNLMVCLETEEIAFPPIAQLVNELKSAEYVTAGATGRSRVQVPEGLPDDCIMALGLTAWGMTNAGAGLHLAHSFVERTKANTSDGKLSGPVYGGQRLMERKF